MTPFEIVSQMTREINWMENRRLHYENQIIKLKIAINEILNGAEVPVDPALQKHLKLSEARRLSWERKHEASTRKTKQ